MFKKLVEGVVEVKILAQLTRIADSLEIIAGVKELKKSNENPDFTLLETTEEEVIKEEIEEKQKIISKVLEKNEGGFLWAEDNLENSDLENIQ